LEPLGLELHVPECQHRTPGSGDNSMHKGTASGAAFGQRKVNNDEAAKLEVGSSPFSTLISAVNETFTLLNEYCLPAPRCSVPQKNPCNLLKLKGF
jgi:hypothetical protein